MYGDVWGWVEVECGGWAGWLEVDGVGWRWVEVEGGGGRCRAWVEVEVEGGGWWLTFHTACRHSQSSKCMKFKLADSWLTVG